MTAYTTISNDQVDQDSPVTTPLLTALRDNPTAIAEGDAAAPRVKPVIFHVSHREASGSNGGTTVSGSFRTRTLNTVEVNGVTGASLSGNVITLPAGTYDAWIISQFDQSGKANLRLRNTTDSVDVVLGMPINVPSGVSSLCQSRGRFTIAASKSIEMQYYVETGTTSTGLGRPASSGVDEIWAQVILEKVG